MGERGDDGGRESGGEGGIEGVGERGNEGGIERVGKRVGERGWWKYWVKEREGYTKTGLRRHTIKPIDINRTDVMKHTLYMYIVCGRIWS